MLPDDLKSEIVNLGGSGKDYKPHKHIALLVSIEILRGKGFNDNIVYFSDQFQRLFTGIFSRYSSGNDRDRPYTPFFHLRTSSFWRLVPKINMDERLKETTTVGGPTALSEMVDHAEVSDSLMHIVQDEVTCSFLEGLIHNCLSNRNHEVISMDESAYHGQSLRTDDNQYPVNPFVDYLNSLQRTSAGNENAIAESQACNPQFGYIHVPHSLSRTIVSELKDKNGKHVILTGHAGDGKSTIAVEVFKHLKRIPPNQHLDVQLQPREDISEQAISIIKDLSERYKSADQELLQEIVDHTNRFLLVTNTGTLLDLFRQHCDLFDLTEPDAETRILNAIGNDLGEAELRMGKTVFRVFNLAKIDNLHIARRIFANMCDVDRWVGCADRSCRLTCPVYSNVVLLQTNQEKVLDRIFLAYRRMYEYGTRLTIRQLTEHFAYLITSGLSEADIHEMRQKNITDFGTQYMFFNRFFGDNGRVDDAAAQQMQAIREVARQRFGERPCPTWERRLWLRSRGRQFQLGIEGIDGVFEELRDYGSKPRSENNLAYRPESAREQVRRILYFLYDFSEEDQSYLGQYLNSPTILRWQLWQETNAQLDWLETASLGERVYHVLQEHFTGIRLPEMYSQRDERRLYVTLNRHRNEVRQSAQVVLAQVDWSTAVKLELCSLEDAIGGTRTDLVLKGRDHLEGTDLRLTLPFLDYVVMRHFGELGEVLQTAYRERLNQFKAQVQKKASSADESIMLVRLKTDHTFRRQHYSIRNERLEVNDAL